MTRADFNDRFVYSLSARKYDYGRQGINPDDYGAFGFSFGGYGVERGYDDDDDDGEYMYINIL